MVTGTMEHVSDTLTEIISELRERKDNEVSELAFVLPQYVTDTNDSAAYKAIDKQVNALERAYDRMIALLEKTAEKVTAIESSVDSFYGD